MVSTIIMGYYIIIITPETINKIQHREYDISSFMDLSSVCQALFLCVSCIGFMVRKLTYWEKVDNSCQK